MKKIRSLLLTFTIAAFVYSCGDAGLGFDVASEVPIDVGLIEIPVPGTAVPTDLNPDEFDFNYNLNQVDGFSDAMNELNKVDSRVYVLGISYEISGVNDPGDRDESVDVEEISLRFNLTNGARTFNIPLSGGILQNVNKTQLNLVQAEKNLLETQLLSSNSLDVDLVFDAGVVTTTATPDIIDFSAIVHFDVALRVRDINN